MHEKGGGFGVGRGLWFPWSPPLLSPSLFLFWGGDEQRPIRWSALASFSGKNPTFSLLAWKTKEQVPCPTPNASISEISITRNPPPQAQTKPGAAAGAVGPGCTRTLRHLCRHRARGKRSSSSLGPRPTRRGEDLPTHHPIVCIHFNAPFPSSTVWRDLSTNKN